MSLGMVRDVVCSRDGQGGVDFDVRFRAQGVPQPTQLDSLDSKHSRGLAEGPLGGVGEFGVDSVEQSAEYIAGGGAHHGKDRDRDDQPNDRVGRRPPEGDAGRTDDYGQGREAVRAGVQPVGNQCG
jgi:hypothetical protein